MTYDRMKPDHNALFSWCLRKCGNQCYHWTGVCQPCRRKEANEEKEKRRNKAAQTKG